MINYGIVNLRERVVRIETRLEVAVEVIGPETLREEFAETAREMHKLYRK